MQLKARPNRSNWFGTLPVTFFKILLPSVLLCLSISQAAAQANSKNVLVLFSSSNSPREVIFLDTFEPAIRARVSGPVIFYTTNLATHLAEDARYRESQAETLQRSYAGIKFNAIIAVSHEALEFALKYRDKISSGAPIVITQITTRELEGQSLPGVTGLTTPVGMGETINLALRLHPDTNTVAVISRHDAFWLAVAHSELLRHNLKVIDLLDPPSREMVAKVRGLPPHTVVLFHRPPEPNHPEFGGWDLLDEVAKLQPTYSAWPLLCLNHGCIGGAYPDLEKEDRKGAEITARVLNGERPEDIPIAPDSDLQVQVDWRALQRWQIQESALPPGSAILYREPTLWQREKKYIVAGIVAVAAQALLIIGLLWQRTRKRRAEAVLRESEKRFRLMADTMPSLVWMCDVHGRITYLNERRIAFTGADPAAGYGHKWADYIHPDDLNRMLEVLAQALKARQPFSQEYRLRRADGVYRWMFDVASPRVNGDGSFGGFIGSVIDTSDQKLAQQALEKVSGQLIEAQEKERSRIARELHDDICQRLALLSIEIEQVNRSPTGSYGASKKNLEEIRQHCSEIAGDVQSMSHQLHSSKLDLLGIVTAIRGFCNEISRQHQVTIDFKDKNVPNNLSKDVSLCLFRVVQEALHNAVKYSGTNKFAVELSATVDEIQLVVSDAGAGFDIEEMKKNRGLGLVSMQERVNLVHGMFSINSKPGAGTRIRVTVPVSVPDPATLTDAGIFKLQGE